MPPGFAQTRDRGWQAAHGEYRGSTNGAGPIVVIGESNDVPEAHHSDEGGQSGPDQHRDRGERARASGARETRPDEQVKGRRDQGRHRHIAHHRHRHEEHGRAGREEPRPDQSGCGRSQARPDPIGRDDRETGQDRHHHELGLVARDSASTGAITKRPAAMIIPQSTTEAL